MAIIVFITVTPSIFPRTKANKSLIPFHEIFKHKIRYHIQINQKERVVTIGPFSCSTLINFHLFNLFQQYFFAFLFVKRNKITSVNVI